MKFKIVFDLVFREMDNFKNGCCGDSLSESLNQSIVIESNSKNNLIEMVCKRFNVTRDSVLINACGEIGRIDVQTYTKTKKGIKCGYKRYQDGFKNGDYNLWLNCFTGSVVLSPQLVDLTK